LAEIDRIEAEWQAGELDDRTAAQALVQVVRDFAGEEAAALTLGELRQRDHLACLATLIEAAYPVEFGVRGEGDIGELAVRARQAVAP
jgi:hypothetical protein